jgi:hypothetical protein
MALPLLAAITLAQAGLGALQAGTSGAKARERELDAYAKQSPLYKGSKSIDDYYQEAMNRYRENPYQSQQYQMGAMQARRATAQGLSALQDRRSAIGGISRLEAGQNYAMQNLGAQAEAQRNARFGQLGGATQMKTGEDYRKFDINQMTPYNRMLQLKQLKAQAANDRYNAGLQMIGGAASNAALGAMYGGFDKAPKLDKTTTAVTETANIPGSPYGKYGSSDFSKYGVGKTGFNSKFGKNYSLPNFGGLPKYPLINEEYFTTEFN